MALIAALIAGADGDPSTDPTPGFAHQGQAERVCTIAMTPASVIVSKRDPRIDVLRGIALLMIFVDHIPGDTLGWVTNCAWVRCLQVLFAHRIG